jgi:hypothetical protein
MHPVRPRSTILQASIVHTLDTESGIMQAIYPESHLAGRSKAISMASCSMGWTFPVPDGLTVF